MPRKQNKFLPAHTCFLFSSPSWLLKREVNISSTRPSVVRHRSACDWKGQVELIIITQHTSKSYVNDVSVYEKVSVSYMYIYRKTDPFYKVNNYYIHYMLFWLANIILLLFNINLFNNLPLLEAGHQAF